MVEAGEWTTTKLINLILGIVLLIIIVVGSISGQIDPLIDQVGAKFDEWSLKSKTIQRDYEISGDLEVNPDGTCKLLNVGDNKDNYTLNYYSNDFFLNDVQVNAKVINEDIKSLEKDLESLKEDRELYYTILEKLEEENLLNVLGRNTGVKVIRVGTLRQFILNENGLTYLVDIDESKILLKDKPINNLEDLYNNVGPFMLLFYFSFDSSEQIPNNLSKIQPKDYPEEYQNVYKIKELRNMLVVDFINQLSTLEYPPSEKRIIKMNKGEFSLNYVSDPLPGTSQKEIYPFIKTTKVEGGKIFAVQFTSNYIYFIDLILEKEYIRENLNKNNYLMYEYNSQTGNFEELQNKEYILNDEAFNEMIELNKAYVKLKEGCV